jgi:hypothetical protein
MSNDCDNSTHDSKTSKIKEKQKSMKLETQSMALQQNLESLDTEQSYVTIAPAYIAASGDMILADGTKEKINALFIELLDKEKWLHLLKSQQNILNEHRFIYVVIDLKQNTVVELGVHNNYCLKIKELHISRIFLGEYPNLNMDPQIQPLPDISYSKMINYFLPKIS